MVFPVQIGILDRLLGLLWAVVGGGWDVLVAGFGLANVSSLKGERAFRAGRVVFFEVVAEVEGSWTWADTAVGTRHVVFEFIVVVGEVARENGLALLLAKD